MWARSARLCKTYRIVFASRGFFSFLFSSLFSSVFSKGGIFFSGPPSTLSFLFILSFSFFNLKFSLINGSCF
ncbi:hypothetical protein HOY80DRAFT_939314 [Tuber brumale]|nr:hypothetical protein HOY80DRAFT_939314 [Tuber brumale]